MPGLLEDAGLRKQAEDLLSGTLSPYARGRLAEIYTAIEFGLVLAPTPNERGYDCVEPATGARWEVKCRAASTQHVDANHIDGFARMVLVHLAKDGRAADFWLVEQEDVPKLFTRREDFGKWQVRQDKFKKRAQYHRPTKISLL